MLTQSQVLQMQDRVTQTLAQAGIVLTLQEQEQIEVVDFGLSELERTGLQLVIYINNDRYCAKELVMIPRQTCAASPSAAQRDQSGQAGDVSLPVGQGLALCRRRAQSGYSSACTGRQRTILHDLSRDRTASRRPVHDPTEHLALVPIGRRRSYRFRIFEP